MQFNWEREPIHDAAISAIVTVPPGASALERVVGPLAQVLDKRDRGFEILVIDETCKPLDVEKLRPIVRLRVVESEKPGHGAALRAGLKEAANPLVFTFPATGEYDPADLVKLMENIDKADVICGQRQGLGWAARWRAWLVPYGLFGVNFKDVRCPVRLYRRDIFKRIPIQSASGFAEVEILAKATFLERIFDEVPISWKPTGVTVDSGTVGDVWKVFNHPNFGPVHVEDAPPTGDASAAAAG